MRPESKARSARGLHKFRRPFSASHIDFVTQGCISSMSKLRRRSIRKFEKNLPNEISRKRQKIAKLTNKYIESYLGMLFHLFNCCIIQNLFQFCFVMSHFFCPFCFIFTLFVEIFSKLAGEFFKILSDFQLESFMDCDL